MEFGNGSISEYKYLRYLIEKHKGESYHNDGYDEQIRKTVYSKFFFKL